jgi:hypothetical protein
MSVRDYHYMLHSSTEERSSHTLRGWILEIATASFVMSVRLSAWNNSTLTGRIFMAFHMSIFGKSVEKIQV